MFWKKIVLYDTEKISMSKESENVTAERHELTICSCQAIRYHGFGSFTVYNKTIPFSNSTTVMKKFLKEKHPWILLVSACFQCTQRVFWWGSSWLKRNFCTYTKNTFLLYHTTPTFLKTWGIFFCIEEMETHFLQKEWCHTVIEMLFTSDLSPNMSAERVELTGRTPKCNWSRYHRIFSTCCS